jgi:hypothetical protein
VVGVDTHRDTYDAEIATPMGVPIATIRIPNTSEGFATLLAWMAKTAPARAARHLFAAGRGGHVDPDQMGLEGSVFAERGDRRLHGRIVLDLGGC